MRVANAAAALGRSAVELLGRELADRLEHREALAAPVGGAPDQALVDERCEHVDDVDVGQPVAARRRHRSTASICATGRRTACGTAARSSSSSRSWLHAIVSRSVRCRSGQVARAAAQDVEPPRQPIAQLLDREQAQPCRRELDRERQPVEARADLRRPRRVLVGQGRSRVAPRSRARRTGGRPRTRRAPRPTARSTRASREARAARRRSSCSPRTCSDSRLVTMHAQVRTQPEEVGDVVRGRHHLLEVVEDEQQVALADLFGDGRRRSRAGREPRCRGPGRSREARRRRRRRRTGRRSRRRLRSDRPGWRRPAAQGVSCRSRRGRSASGSGRATSRGGGGSARARTSRPIEERRLRRAGCWASDRGCGAAGSRPARPSAMTW